MARKTPKPLEFKRVLLIGLSMGGFDEQVTAGINKYRRLARPWLVYNAGHDRRFLEPILDRSQVDGVIANVTDEALAQRLHELGKPVVDLSGFASRNGCQLVSLDNQAIGQMAAEYFLSRGYHHLVYTSYAALPFERQRWESFVAAARQRGADAQWMQVAAQVQVDREGRQRPLESREIVCHWLQDMPRPLAVFAAFERIGAIVSDNCRLLRLSVPQEVSILVAGDMPTICESAYTPLSAIEFPGQRVGYEAAGRLDQMMVGKDPGPSPCLFGPLGIVARASTESHAIEDQTMARALGFIRECACQRINVADVVEHVGMDRRNFDRRFRQIVGHTPLEEIYRVRIDLAKRQLIDTDVKIQEVALKTGFRDGETMSRHFHRALNMTPEVFRQQFRLR